MMIRPVHLLAVCLAGQLSTAGVVVLAREHPRAFPLLVSSANNAAAQPGPVVAANTERTSYERIEERLTQMERAFDALERERDRFAERNLRLTWQQLLSETLREHSGVFARDRVSGAGGSRVGAPNRGSFAEVLPDDASWGNGKPSDILDQMAGFRNAAFTNVGGDGMALLDELGASLEQFDALRGGRIELASGGDTYAALDSVLSILDELNALSGRAASRGALAEGNSGDSFSGALDSVTVLLDELNELQAGRQRASLADRFGQVLGEGAILENRQRGTALLFLWLWQRHREQVKSEAATQAMAE